MASPSPDLTLIGLCDGQLDTKRHQSTFLTNKVGGQSDVVPVVSRQFPRCIRCGAALAHVVQVYCPLEASPYHRNLHLYACVGAECSGRSECWRVLRSQCLETEVAQTPSQPVPAQEAPLSATDWCDTADDWGMEEEQEDGWGGDAKSQNTPQQEAPETKETQAAGEMDVSSRLQDLHLGGAPEDAPVFHPFFISVVEESDLGGEEDDLAHAQDLLRDYERREGVAVAELEGSEGGGGGEEKYEKTKARHGDAIFSRFMKIISLCPQQILRYCRGGKPLFISEPPSNMAHVVSSCSSCGGSRTFELQLMPALVSLLQREGGGSSEAQLEFGTVLVYTCTNSCWTTGSASAVDEFCFVQTDPDQQLFK
ncbi:programmed cell death protein 2-like [Sphaeramia orbicularis]|uniref:Programmed cell death protein 2 C-terminal domain-containing protein n=1 Tax=Sphaeramia orbicularis TaxID=375764 RepID=A0A672YDT7_9TELE|nr:programmed cell death protein 2-like [Sphaeramia orbicularis]